MHTEQSYKPSKSGYYGSKTPPQNRVVLQVYLRIPFVPTVVPFCYCNGLARCPKNHLRGSLIPNTPKTREIKRKNIVLKPLYTMLSVNIIVSLEFLKFPYNSRFLLPVIVSFRLFVVSLQPVKLAKIREGRWQTNTRNKSNLPP